MLKCAIFADFLDFENGCCYLNTIACKIKKNHGFLVFLLKIIHYFIGLNTSLSSFGWSWEKNYVKMWHFGRFLRF